MRHLLPREKLIAVGHGLVALGTLVFAAASPEVRAPMLALCVGAVAQLPIWLSAPMTHSGPPRRTVIALEGGVAIGSVIASILASAWFALPAILTIVTTIGLVWARRVGPAASPPEEVREVRADASRRTTISVNEFLALYPGLDRLGTVFMTFFLILAALCVLMVAADPRALVGAAACAGLAATPRLGVWLSTKTLPPSHQRAVERRRRQSDAEGGSGRPAKG